MNVFKPYYEGEEEMMMHDSTIKPKNEIAIFLDALHKGEHSYLGYTDHLYRIVYAVAEVFRDRNIILYVPCDESGSAHLLEIDNDHLLPVYTAIENIKIRNGPCIRKSLYIPYAAKSITAS